MTQNVSVCPAAAETNLSNLKSEKRENEVWIGRALCVAWMCHVNMSGFECVIIVVI